MKEDQIHLAHRLTFGATPGLLAEIEAVGAEAFIEEQLDPQTIDDSEIDGLLTHFSTLDLSVAEIFEAYREQPRLVVGELILSTLLRAIYSRRQLFEVMVDFWSNHFNIYIGDGAVRFLKSSDDRDVIRTHAMGRFDEMLLASARSPAMLYYLDNYLSRGDDPNENYARELLELHTLGVDGGYSEEDVRATALCLSGWTIRPEAGGFFFAPPFHFPGPLQILGWSTPGRQGPDAVVDGEDLLSYLAHHPSTARHLAYKLCVRFVSDEPPADLVESCAAVYLENQTGITPVLRHIFSSGAFLQSGGNRFKRPLELLIGLLRTLESETRTTSFEQLGRSLHFLLQRMGQTPFGWHAPNGYPDVAGAWINTGALLARWNTVQAIVANRVPGVDTRLEKLLDVTPRTGGELLDRLAERVLFQPLSQSDRETLLDYLEMEAEEPLRAEAVRYKAPQAVALILNSTYFQFR